MGFGATVHSVTLRFALCFLQGPHNFIHRPAVAAPKLRDFAVRGDQRSRQTVADRAAFGLPINSKRFR